MQLEPFEKTFMQGIPNLPQDQVDAWRTENQITVEGSNCPAPLRSFQECPFPQNIMQRFTHMGFKAPTPCQSQGWPMALTGRDVVCIAETGSGKTIGFVLPALIHIKHQKPLQQGDGPIALVVAPTRELASQIEKEARLFGGEMGVRMCCVYGGAPKRNQEYTLRGGCEMVICTPGRMLDFIEGGRIWRNMNRTTYVVFDEADRMLDMGFEPQIRALLGQIRPDRQMQMWSATWPKAVRQLAHDFLPNDKIIMKIGSDDGKACERVTQKTIICSSYDKQKHLKDALLQYPNDKILVFTGTKRMADDLSRRLGRCGVHCAAIHGDKKQFDRERTLREFKNGRVNVMIATDVASRGIHVDNIRLVINYDFPQCLDDYIHRIGRTGRAGTYGNAMTFFDMKKDGKKSRGYAKILRDANQEVPPQLMQGGHYGGGNNFRSRHQGRPY